MNTEAFRAQRRALFEEVDELLVPSVRAALTRYMNGETRWWRDLMVDALDLWGGVFGDEAPNADPRTFADRFSEMVGEALLQTDQPEGDVDEVQVLRVATWLGTVLVNDATWSGAAARGVRFKRWVTMRDGSVRTIHRSADGQIADIDGTFDIGGYDLRYPGEPIGPPEIWINCRCTAQPAARTGDANVTSTTFAIDEDDITEPDVDEILPLDEPEEGEEEITEIPIHGVLAPEGVVSGDHRLLAPNSLTTRELPIPLRYETVSSHGGDTSHVVTVGRVDEVWREGNMMRYKGVLVVNRPEYGEVMEGIINGTVRGVSIDGDNPVIEASNFDGDDNETPTTFTALRVAGLTIVPIPAFQEAYISLGHEFEEDMTDEDRDVAAEALAACGCSGPDDENPDIEMGYDAFDSDAETFAPGTKDGPGWITHPIPTARIRRYWVRGKGAAKIRWGVPGDFNRCRRQLGKYVQNPDWLAGLCANMHKEAIGVWPGREKGGRHSLMASGQMSPAVSLVAAGSKVYDSSLFAHHGRKEGIGVVIEDDHVFGYVAHWGTCHIGYANICTTPPKSLTNYAYFRTGVVETDKGPVHVGQITMNTGHAAIRSNAKIAAAHYDNTGAAVADVVVGEDEVGIWFSGVLREGVTEKQKNALAAAGRLSGDWRSISNNLEMVAALAVNVPGFPIPRTLAASGQGMQTALVAAGVVDPQHPTPATFSSSPEDIAGIVRTAVAEFVDLQDRKARLAPLRDADKKARLASIRAKIKD